MSGNNPRSRIEIHPIAGLSGYKLSKMVNEIDFRRPNARGQLRSGATTKAVLRALCDRYPKVWASVATDAENVGISERQFQRELRRLEKHYRLILGIGNKRGGRHQETTQYFILDRKILNIVEMKRLFEQWEQATSETSSHAGTGDIPATQRATSEQGRVTSQTNPGDISNSKTGGTSDIPVTQIDHSLSEHPLRDQKEQNIKPTTSVQAGEVGSPSSERSGKSKIQELQESVFYYLGEYTKDTKSDPEQVARLEQQFGWPTVKLAFCLFLDDDQNTTTLDGTQIRHLISQFTKASSTELIAQRIKPLADAGFRNAEAVKFVQRWDVEDEIANLTPEEIQRFESAFTRMLPRILESQYCKFYEQREDKTLGSFIMTLGEPTPIQHADCPPVAAD